MPHEALVEVASSGTGHGQGDDPKQRRKKKEGLGYSLREPQAMWYVESSVAGASVETEKTNETS